MLVFIFIIYLFNKKNIHTPRLMNYLPHFRYIALKPGNKSIQHSNDLTKIRAFISKTWSMSMLFSDVMWWDLYLCVQM